jgi:DNA polymerase-1
MTWLLLDVNNLCYRAFYVMGHLSHGDVRTGMIYGFLRDVANLRRQFQTDRVVFCFDHGKNKRENILSQYKETRKANFAKLPKDKQTLLLEMKQQVELLRTDYLPSMGYNNVFYADGYEADDIIASVCKHQRAGRRYVIVSTDSDLLQLINDRVSVHGSRLWNEQSFTDRYGIDPVDWVHVKALSGCSTDDIPGVSGIGEKTAIKFLLGNLSEKSKAHQKIAEGWKVWQNNLALVQLPYYNCPQFDLQDDEVTVEKWRAVADKLGIKSLPAPVPVFQGKSR